MVWPVERIARSIQMMNNDLIQQSSWDNDHFFYFVIPINNNRLVRPPMYILILKM